MLCSRHPSAETKKFSRQKKHFGEVCFELFIVSLGVLYPQYHEKRFVRAEEGELLFWEMFEVLRRLQIFGEIQQSFSQIQW